MLTIDVRINRLDLPGRGLLLAALERGMQKAVFHVARRAKLALSGQVLKVRTGRLRSSVTTRVLRRGSEIIGTVGTNVFYGRIHELGRPGPWTIQAVRRRALAFTAGGKRVIVRQVTHPGLKARPWLRPALTESRAEIEALFRAEIERAVNA